MNKRTAQLKRERQSADVIKAAEDAYSKKDKEHSLIVDSYLKKNSNYGKVGAFEGAGYVPNGMYRPMLDCMMFSKGNRPFCKVCEEHIIKVIGQYTE